VKVGAILRVKFAGLPGLAKTVRHDPGDSVRVAQQDRAQDSLLLKLGVAFGNGATDPLKVGESWGVISTLPIPSQAPPEMGGEGVETGWAGPKAARLGSRDSPDHERRAPAWRRRKPKWYESWGRGFESRRGHHLPIQTTFLRTTAPAVRPLSPRPSGQWPIVADRAGSRNLDSRISGVSA
jgi:hypothetical protein